MTLKLIMLCLAVCTTNVFAMENNRLKRTEKSENLPQTLKHKVAQDNSTNSDSTPINDNKISDNTSAKKIKKTANYTIQCSKCKESFKTKDLASIHISTSTEKKCKKAEVRCILTAASKAALQK